MNYTKKKDKIKKMDEKFMPKQGFVFTKHYEKKKINNTHEHVFTYFLKGDSILLNFIKDNFLTGLNKLQVELTDSKWPYQYKAIQLENNDDIYYMIILPHYSYYLSDSSEYVIINPIIKISNELDNMSKLEVILYDNKSTDEINLLFNIENILNNIDKHKSDFIDYLYKIEKIIYSDDFLNFDNNNLFNKKFDNFNIFIPDEILNAQKMMLLTETINGETNE